MIVKLVMSVKNKKATYRCVKEHVEDDILVDVILKHFRKIGPPYLVEFDVELEDAMYGIDFNIETKEINNWEFLRKHLK